MINILIPLAGKNQFFSEAEYPFPKPLIEFNGKTMIEHIIDNFSTIQKEKQFIFIVNSEDCKKYHLDNVLNILTNQTCKIIKLDNETKGAACSAMMAVEYINNDMPLIISNADQLFNISLDEVINNFGNSDAGVITFESIHPRWSYVRLNKKNKVTETAEKRPISKNAIAGFYYFRKGSDFISSSSKMIKKDASVNGLYYISPVLNEMVLENKIINIFQIANDKYHTFYTPQKIKEYERLMSC
ncbi:glycosyltransferase family 2 protein [Aliarcobacter butzleri]|uniref:Glycosyltransferase family 2 protein n=1 Tax=Aliarcobacter butzleri TaxID=28197 RepID=A0AAP4Q0G2_9BACT|nr:glycosyltransferase family 2 protein [Aliarcobacter butzleri]MDN5053008.1 glycosyltransferase family 2 protein [Aliarcobacter butzleri]MDN5076008.1 glycosyltransferase family 2 protein [Aliarcobacter butzleri]MDN5117385.1 glycosyltransferase family 2 protein [Aliarcobacter butzleri]MDN5133255.1 glycosyltransferase family 2 protein [Aliarcobacter butzleri]NUW26527.1 NTP transferase domain-containing protein [Aliarcobacter butzleri]